MFYLFLILFLNQQFFCKLVQLQFLSRHCDRTSAFDEFEYFENYPESTNIDHVLKTSYGELTPLGHRECYLLGESLRNRYLNDSSSSKISNLSFAYNSKDYHFRSTAFDRTLMSGYSISLGLFPLFGGPTIDVGPYEGEHGYPSGEQATPYMTEALPNSILFDMDNCETLKQNRAASHFTSFYNEHSDLIGQYSNLTGNKVPDTTSFFHLWDLGHVLWYHNLLPLPIQEIWNETQALGNELFKKMYNRNTLINYGGGPFLNELILQMNKFMKDDLEAKKFLHYSAHDTTLISVLAAMDVLKSYPLLQGLPPYGSVILFELHEDDDHPQSYYVKMYFKYGWDGDYLPIELNHCTANDCSFPNFNTSIHNVGIVSTEEWCEYCGNTESNDCLNVQVKSLKDQLTSAQNSRDKLLIITILAGAFCIFLILLIFITLCVYVCEKKMIPLALRQHSSSSPLSKSDYNELREDQIMQE